MSDWNTELPRFKEARRDPENLRPASKGRRQPRKWKVMLEFAGSELVAYTAISQVDAQRWIDKQTRMYWVGRRNVAQAVIDAAVKRSLDYAKRYRIEPPKA